MKGSPFVTHLCSSGLNFLLCGSRILSVHAVSNGEGVLFGTASQQLRKCLLARETKKSAAFFTALILKTAMYLQKQEGPNCVWSSTVGHNFISVSKETWLYLYKGYKFRNTDLLSICNTQENVIGCHTSGRI